MKSCIEWRKSFKYLPQIDEFNIDYRNKEVQLLKFLEKYAISQKVNIKIGAGTTIDDIELLNEIKKVYKYNISVCFMDYMVATSLIEKCDVPYYFYDAAYSWEDFEYFLSQGVSEIIVSGDLAFDLERVRLIADENDIALRAYVNIVQSTHPLSESDLGFKRFFIRPEDMDYYSNFIDVCEFYNSVDKQNVLYEIYFHDKEWNGNLQEIIQGLKIKVNNYYILGSEFARRRSQCNRKCEKGSRCQLCNRLIELADSLENSSDYEVFKKETINGGKE